MANNFKYFGGLHNEQARKEIQLRPDLNVELQHFLLKKENLLKRVVDSAVYLCNIIFTMSEIREAILKQMNKSGMTIYQVGKLVEDKVPQRTVYAFLTGMYGKHRMY